jgi:hypothetical protein
MARAFKKARSCAYGSMRSNEGVSLNPEILSLLAGSKLRHIRDSIFRIFAFAMKVNIW